VPAKRFDIDFTLALCPIYCPPQFTTAITREPRRTYSLAGTPVLKFAVWLADRLVQVAKAGQNVYVPLEGIVDFEAEAVRLTKEREKYAVELERLEKKLSNESFVARAKPEVVEAEREKLESQKVRAAQLQEALSGLQD